MQTQAHKEIYGSLSQHQTDSHHAAGAGHDAAFHQLHHDATGSSTQTDSHLTHQALKGGTGSYHLPGLDIIGENGSSLTGSGRDARPQTAASARPAEGGTGSPSAQQPETDAHRQATIKAAQNTLSDANATAQDKLSTVQMLANSGVHDIQLPDKNGQMRNYTIEQEKLGNHQLVHLFGQDQNGHRQVALRGVGNSDGTFSQEQDKSGNKVSFEGSTWARHMSEKSSVGQMKDSSDSTSTNSNNNSNNHSGWHNNGNSDQGGPHKRHNRHNRQNGDNNGSPSDNQPASPNPNSDSQHNPPPVQDNSDRTVTGVYHARGTGYYPANNAMEGGFKDMKGKPLHTLQDYLDGKSSYVSVAMDNHAGIKYGQNVTIPELDSKYGQHIPFKVVDTGGAFTGRGHSRIDICTRNNHAAHDSTINGPLTLEFTN
ncbi:MAG TPA: hypothetical protein V6C72_06140 [Chroococcales cyanobacterium]